MARRTWVGLLGALVLLAGVAPAADDGLAGTWKVTFLDGDHQAKTYWLVKLADKGGKWDAQIVATDDNVPESTLSDLRVAADQVRFAVNLGGRKLVFQGKLPAVKGRKVLGVLVSGRNLSPAWLEGTALKGLSEAEVHRDLVANADVDNPRLFDAAAALIGSAAATKATPVEVRGWADRAFRAAEAYGPRWQAEVSYRLAEALANQDGFLELATNYARRAERLLEPGQEPQFTEELLRLQARLARLAKKPDEEKDVLGRLARVVELADAEYLKRTPAVKAEKFAGRKGKGERVALVELFTGAQCPPCVAADLGFDALLKTYKPSEAVFLQYHVHVPGPDPLANADTMARMESYGDAIEGAPATLFNGKPDAGGGGPAAAGEEKYKEYREVLEPLLEKESGLKLKARAVRQGDRIDITAEVSDLAAPGATTRLRLALTEETVRYTGGNGVRFHHHVVRAMPGGVKGFALEGKTGKHTARVDLGELRKSLTQYLDDFAKENPFPNAQRPMELKNLRVVAFVQNDRTKEVLQAAQVDVPAAD